jgi:hypothetical protein
VRINPTQVGIQWAATSYSKVLERWQRYKRKHPGFFATAREARVFANAFAKKEQERADTLRQADLTDKMSVS